MEVLAVIVGTGLLAFLVVVGAYVLTSIFMMQLFKKAKVALWKAWVPVVNIWTFLEIGGQKGWWTVVAIAGSIVGSMVMALGGAGAATTTYTTTTTSYGNNTVTYYQELDDMDLLTTNNLNGVGVHPNPQAVALGGMALVGYLIVIASAVLLFVFECIAAYNIGLKLGWGGGMVVLFIFVNIVWLGIAGLGKAKFDDKKGKPSLAKKVA